MVFETEGGINLRIMNECLYECGDAIPSICPICKNQIDTQKYIINHSIKAYRCSGCSRLFVLYNDWVFMPNREFYNVEHDIGAVRNRRDNADEERIDKKLKQTEELLNRNKHKLERASKKKKEEEAKNKRDMGAAVKKRDGEPLGKRPKQRKRSMFS